MRSSRGEGRAMIFLSPLARCALALGVVAGLVGASPAHADFRICNRMSYIVDTAIGVFEAGSWATRGWFRLNPAQCETVAPDALNADRYFLHARALSLYGEAPVPQGRREMLCVADRDFVIGAARTCRSGQRPAPFIEIKPSVSETGQIAYLGEPSEYDDEQARLAGIQRLLDLAGYDAKPIDGLEGPKTSAAIEKFMREKNLDSANVQSAALFDALLAAAQSPAGVAFTWCNETPFRIMAALGIENGEAVTTHGWYRVEPGACVHPDVPEGVRRVFSFAEAVDGEGRPLKRDGMPIHWGGSRMLCTRDSKFEASGVGDCAERALRESGFATIDIDGGARTYRFKAE